MDVFDVPSGQIADDVNPKPITHARRSRIAIPNSILSLARAHDLLETYSDGFQRSSPQIAPCEEAKTR